MLRSTLNRVLPALALATAIVSALPVARAVENPSGPAGKGAQVYCFMRNSGNNHEVSWLAAYALIKRQSASLFKTSPTHAAVMITEAVVQNPNAFPNCGRYLGDLYSTRVPATSQAPASSEGESDRAVSPSSQAGLGGKTRSERFGN